MVYLWVSTGLGKCSTSIQQLGGGLCPGEPVEKEGEEGMLGGRKEGELEEHTVDGLVMCVCSNPC